MVALVALIGTWANNLQMIDPRLGFIEGNAAFWRATLATPASRSITVDLFWLGFPVIAWMLFEARRLKMRGAWAYVIAGFFIAISVTVPVFMLQRERVLLRETADAGVLKVGDLVGLALLAATAVGYTVIALR